LLPRLTRTIGPLGRASPEALPATLTGGSYRIGAAGAGADEAGRAGTVRRWNRDTSPPVL
jgi:hypothetical protein